MPSLRGWNRRATHTGGKGPGCPPRMLFPDLSPLASGSLGRHGPSPRPGWRLGPNETACQPYPPSVQSPLPQIRGRSRRPREPTCNPTHPPSLGTWPCWLRKAESHPRGHMSAFPCQAAERAREESGRGGRGLAGFTPAPPRGLLGSSSGPAPPDPRGSRGQPLEAPSHARATSPGPVHPQGWGSRSNRTCEAT